MAQNEIRRPFVVRQPFFVLPPSPPVKYEFAPKTGWSSYVPEFLPPEKRR